MVNRSAGIVNDLRVGYTVEDNFTGGDSWRFGFIFGELTEHGGGALKRSADAERPKCEAVRVYDRDRGSFLLVGKMASQTGMLQATKVKHLRGYLMMYDTMWGLEWSSVSLSLGNVLENIIATSSGGGD